MNTLKSVFTRLKKVDKEKVNLSSVSELQKWNDFYGVDSNNFNEIKNLESILIELQNSFVEFRSKYNDFKEGLNYINDNYNINEVISNVAKGQMLLTNFESKASELGLDAKTNQTYNDVIESREDLIRFMEDLRYVLILSESVEEDINTFN